MARQRTENDVSLTKKAERYCSTAEAAQRLQGGQRPAPVSQTPRQRQLDRDRLRRGLEFLFTLQDELIAWLDELEGEPDLEDDEREEVSEDEGAQCEDEGANTFDNELGADDEPDDYHVCGWISGEVDQTNHYLPGTALTGLNYVDNAGLHPWERADG